ncbi:AraC family transcriptional regulator [Streptomyces sp. BI20]|uniref:AraC family transcriptional regulator n=1 Tax=Streptomyces sp. BI20 TaxID=3403460 RepID=UPI003C71A609
MATGIDRELTRLLERIEEAVGTGAPVDAAALAREALTTEYHLRRLFSALAGMPLSEYVRRRRLTVAGADVLHGTDTLLEIAVRHGWGSGEAFARAFRAVHGIGPGEARRTGAPLRAQPRLSFRLVVEGSTTMRYRVVEKEEFVVIGPATRVPLVFEGVNPHIARFLRGLGRETLGRLGTLAEAHPGEPEGLLAVTVNVDPGRAEGTELDYHHGFAAPAGTPAPEADWTVLDVPAGTWAVFTDEGPFPASLQNLWRDVHTQWFPAQPYRFRPGPEILRTRLEFPAGVEPTPDGPLPEGATASTELWIPVER